MDFTYHYSQTQETFRAEVAAWLDAQLSSGNRPAVDVPQTKDRPSFLDLRRALGGKGWLAPSEPVAHGGMGASQGEDVILAEELDRRGLGWLQDRGTGSLTLALHAWASQPRLTDLIADINRGRVSIWHTCITPQEMDAASEERPPGCLDITASEDGDDYVLNGHAWFAGPAPTPDYVWTLAHLDSEVSGDDGPGEDIPGEDGPATTISLLVPAGSKGIASRDSRRLVEDGPRQVGFDQVRVPRSLQLGPKGEGWALMHSALNAGPETAAPPTLGPAVVRLQEYADTATRNGALLIEDLVIQQMVMDAYIEGRVARLFKTRDAWMRASGQKTTYQPAQTRMWQKRAARRYSQTVRQVVGAYALLDKKDPRAPAQGEFELQQRKILASIDPTGVSGSDADMIAWHLGMTKGHEKSTAQS